MRTWRFPSRTGGEGHDVVLGVYGLECNCMAGQHGKTCWAMRKAQADLDIEAMTRTRLSLSNLPKHRDLMQEAWDYIETQKFMREVQMGLTALLIPMES